MGMELFLDTNVFESTKFSYDSENMNKFLEYCQLSDVNLKLIDVVKYEVEKRIRVNITEAIENIKKDNLGVLASSLCMNQNISKITMIESLITNLIKRFEDFLDENDIEIIDSNYTPKDLVTRYFEKKPPFTEQKKYEFPDAIILLSIKKYIQDYPLKTIATISNDKSFNDFAEENKINNFSFISSALSYLIQNPNITLKNAFERQIESIKEEIEQRIKEQEEFTIYSYDSLDSVDVDDISVDFVTINNLDIVDFIQSENMLTLDSKITIEFSCDAYYPDPDSIHYDKEDGIYYSFSSLKSRINFSESVICSSEIAFDEDYNFDLTDLSLSSKEFEFYLNDRYIIDTEYLDDDRIHTF